MADIVITGRGLPSTVVKTDQANTFSTGAQSLASATSLLVPTSAGYAPTADGSLGYDSTQDAWVGGGAGAIKGFFPRVLYTTSCSAEANCTTEGDTGGTGGNQNTASVNNTAVIIFASKWTAPANYFIAGKAIRIHAVFQYTSSATPPNLDIILQAGSTNLAGNVGASVFPGIASKTNHGFGVSWLVQGTAAPGASVSVEIGQVMGGAPALNNNRVAQPVALATNGSLALQISSTWSTNTAGNVVQLRQFWVEELS